jgi:hypothetical protein
LNEPLQPVSIVSDKKPGLSSVFGYQVMSGSSITNPYGRVQPVFGRDYPRSGTGWQHSPTPELNERPRCKQRGYPAENYNRPKGREIKPSSAGGGLKQD